MKPGCGNGRRTTRPDGSGVPARINWMTGDKVTNKAEKRIDSRQYQAALLSILDAYIELCTRHQLEYYLNAGSLLGAVRHQGFIPWDDDIDLCMPRTDYEKFLRLAPEELPGHLRAVWFGIQKEGEHPQYSCQIQDRNFPIVQMTASVPRKTYAWIDVFPLDGMPPGRIRRTCHGLRLLWRRMRVQVSMFDENVNVNRKNRPVYEKALIWLFRKTGWGRGGDTQALMKKLDLALKRYSEADSPLWINFMGAYKLKEITPAAAYRDGIPYLFEGRKLMGPRDADAVLRKIYGDYMTPDLPRDSDSHRLYQDVDRKGATNDEGTDS